MPHLFAGISQVVKVKERLNSMQKYTADTLLCRHAKPWIVPVLALQHVGYALELPDSSRELVSG